MEAYIRQKRASPGMVQASDLQMRPMSGSRNNGREIHAYEGPLQFMMSPNNPDQLIQGGTMNTNMSSNKTSSSDGKCEYYIFPSHRLSIVSHSTVITVERVYYVKR